MPILLPRWHYGDYVAVEKGGEIIPKVTAVEVWQRKAGAEPVVFLTACPECGAKLERKEGEAQHYCPNEENCSPQVKGRIAHFVGRKAMDIDGMGSETIDLLYRQGLLKDYTDLYTLKAEDIAKQERMGERSAERILEGVEMSKQVPFSRVLFGLGIRFVGATVAKKLANELRTIDAILSATQEELEAIDEIGVKIAESIVAWRNDLANLQRIDRLKQAGVQLEVAESEIVGKTDKLQGLTIVLSGTFSRSRDEIKQLIEQNGGKNSSSVSKNTDYFLAGEKVGPAKMQKVEKLAIKIISEGDLLAMLE